MSLSILLLCFSLVLVLSLVRSCSARAPTLLYFCFVIAFFLLGSCSVLALFLWCSCCVLALLLILSCFALPRLFFWLGLSCVVFALLFICSCCVPARCLLCSCCVLALFLLWACHAFALCLSRARSAPTRARNVSPRARGCHETDATALLHCPPFPSESRAPDVDAKEKHNAPELLPMLANALLIRLRPARPSKCRRSEISLAPTPAVAKRAVPLPLALGPNKRDANRNSVSSTLLDPRVSSLRGEQANLLRMVPVLTNDPRRDSDLQARVQKVDLRSRLPPQFAP